METSNIIENGNNPIISLIGAGKMAWQLFQLFRKKGWQLEEVFSRTLANAHELTNAYGGVKATDSLDFSASKARFFVLCVADKAMEKVLSKLVLPKDAILVHTSGSQPMSVLSQYYTNVGVFYPFQTMSKEKEVDFRQIPFCLEASNEEVMKQLEKMAKEFSNRVYQIDSASRKQLHLAAIFACNFVNHLFSCAQEVLEEASMDFDILEHLVKETVEKAFKIGPKQAQTGPAVRGDHNTISQHLELLNQKEGKLERAQVYELLSSSIENMYTDHQ